MGVSGMMFLNSSLYLTMTSTKGKVKTRIKVQHSHKFTGCYTAQTPCILNWLPKILLPTLKTQKTLTEFQEEIDIWDPWIEIFKGHANWESLLKWCSFLKTQTSQGLFPSSFICLTCHLPRADQVLVVPELTSRVTFSRRSFLIPWLYELSLLWALVFLHYSSLLYFYIDLLLVIHFACLLPVLVLDESPAPRMLSAQNMFVERIYGIVLRQNQNDERDLLNSFACLYFTLKHTHTHTLEMPNQHISCAVKYII